MMSLWRWDQSTRGNSGDLKWHGFSADGAEVWTADAIPTEEEQAEMLVADAVRLVSPFGFAYDRTA